MSVPPDFKIKKQFISAFRPPEPRGLPAWWFAFRNDQVLFHMVGEETVVPCVIHPDELGLSVRHAQYLGCYEGRDCYAADLAPDTVAPPEVQFAAVRELYGRLPDDLWLLAGRAYQLVDWDRKTGFCGCCGESMAPDKRERAKTCCGCGHREYPRISPAVIVLVQHEDRILLVRAHRHPEGMYSNVAGFVEPGETLEEAVHREVGEEAGVQVKNVQYFASQAWPFPNSLMIGFTAEYAGGEIEPETDEIADADWFTPAELPRIPSRISVARALIDWFLNQQQD